MKTDIYFNLHPVNFLIVSGILQIFIVAAILFLRKGDHKRSDRGLSFLLLAVNFHLSYLMILDLNLDNLYPKLLWVPYSYLTAIGPLLFLYTKCYVDEGFKLSSKDLIHFIPLVVELFLQLFQIISASRSGEMYYNVPTDFIITPITYLFAAASIFYYLRRSLGLLRNHELLLNQNFSETGKRTLKWLLSLINCYRVFWMIWIPFAIVFLVIFRVQIQNIYLIIIAYFLLVSLTYLTYWVGLQGFLKAKIVSVNRPVTINAKAGSYSKIPKDEIEQTIRFIKEAMETEQHYLLPELTLRDFASVVNLDQNFVSHILNTYLHQNFYEFVNAYRVEAVKYRFSLGDTDRYTVLAIALDCGFNSKTSFNRVFKEMIGVTPSQYQKQLASKK